MSFNNEGYLSRAELEEMLAGCCGGDATVQVMEVDYKRYVGAVSHLRNKEPIFIAGKRKFPLDLMQEHALVDLFVG